MSWGIVVDADKEPTPPAPAAPRITAWSYSRYAKWVECPRAAYYKFVLKLPEPSSPQMERGSLAHAHAAKVITGQPLSDQEVKASPLTLPWIRRLDATHETYKDDVEAELQLAFTASWQKTSWFGKDAWCRVIFDGLIVTPGDTTVYVQEHKTGKPRTGHLEQATLYAAAVSALLPGQPVEVTLNYFDLPTEKEESRVRHFFAASLASKLKDDWAVKVQPMLEDNDFPTRVGPQCRWCHFRRSNGGQCSKG